MPIDYQIVKGHFCLRRQPMFKLPPFTGFLPRVSGLDSARLQASGLLLLLALAGFSAKTAQAQATATASRGGNVDFFGTYTYTKPDYSGQANNGFTFGGDFLFRKFHFGQPGVAVRYTRTTGPAVHETFFGGGLESHYHFHRVNPFATALIGVGGLSVPITNYSDSGNEFLIGGGVDVPIRHRLSVRGEFDYGFLHISGANGGSQGQIHLTPTSVNVGVVYNFK
jgi:hypothetical protein